MTTEAAVEERQQQESPIDYDVLARGFRVPGTTAVQAVVLHTVLLIVTIRHQSNRSPVAILVDYDTRSKCIPAYVYVD